MGKNEIEASGTKGSIGNEKNERKVLGMKTTKKGSDRNEKNH
jgi:hypothetical protein